jgi:hypothetical protein
MNPAIALNLPELAAGPAAWKDHLARLEADPAPDDPAWARAHTAVLDQIAWFEDHPDLVLPAYRYGRPA